jgi:methyltransferase (TIGR00027 family)
MNPISDTAFYCCGVRMEDAKREHPVCNDRFAERFMDERARRIFEPFHSERMPNISNAVRCRIIDDALRQALEANPRTSIVTIGAGFDTRPYRLAGGDWYEIDEPQIIDYKNSRLPVAESPNPLQRVPIEFAHTALASKLPAPLGVRPVVVVIEGVFLYLEPETIEQIIATLQHTYPRHTLLCDLMTRRFFERFGESVHRKLAAAGSRFSTKLRDPRALFTTRGYIESSFTPMLAEAARLGVLWRELRIPRPVAWLMTSLLARDLGGYGVGQYAFE